jgi:hypothetical protein
MINPSLNWLRPQTLSRYPYQPNLDAIPDSAGVYVFFRLHGRSHQVFYVGKATRLRQRIRTQLNNLKLMNGIKAAANGARLLAYAEVVLKPGQQAGPTVGAAERMLIRHFIEEGHDLLNVQGARIRVQTLTNDRPRELNALLPIRLRLEA